MSGWEVEGTDQFIGWYDTLSDVDAASVDQVVKRLVEQGPGLGRPLVDTITTDLLPNLKELRVGTIRILFVFDPRRVAILLSGGDKRGEWQGWYRQMIPVAVRLYEGYLAEIRREGLIGGTSGGTRIP